MSYYFVILSVIRFCRRQNQRGHLFQGRYKALLIDDASYLFKLVRYIHNNPVGLVWKAKDLELYNEAEVVPYRWKG